jgi:enoyl-CoA hydratase/carnithine racemase
MEDVVMNMMTLELEDTVAIATLHRGITNALNLNLLDELGEAVQKVKSDPGAHGLVLRSSNSKFFSIGFDLPHLVGLSREEFTVFFKRFNSVCLDLYTLPKPTVAAIKGHAIAGGCILAICCDYRFIAEGKKLMGLNEIKLGVPVPYLPDSVLRSIVGVRKARDIMETGEFYQSDRLIQMGLVDEVVPLDQVVSKSIEKARMLGSLPQEAFDLIKRNRVEMVEKEVAARMEEKDRLFIECWYSDEARRRLQDAMEKF